MKKLELIPVVREYGISNGNLQDILVSKVINSENCDCDKESVQNAVKLFISKLKTRIQKHSRNYSVLISKEANWLDGDIGIKNESMGPGPGRPKKSLDECGGRAKRQIVADLCKKCTRSFDFSSSKKCQT